MMYFLQRSARLLVFFLVVLGVIISLPVAVPASADVGPQPILPAGSSLQPDGETIVQMTAEKVVIDIHAPDYQDITDLALQDSGVFAEKIPLVADVDAVFRMLNPGSEAVDMLVWFPLAATLENINYDNFGGPDPGSVAPSIHDFQVLVDNQPVKPTISEFPNPHGEEFPPLPWASFPVNFPAGKETVIEVRYLLPAQSLPGNRVAVLFSYIFRTGAGWAGTIGKAELVVNLPYQALPETVGVMTEGGQISGKQVSWVWTDFEPKSENDFSIELLRPEHWEKLGVLRAAVKANPDSGDAWLNLARHYQAMAFTKGLLTSPGIGTTYQSLAIEAFQTAASLLPEESSIHVSLAILYLPLSLVNASPIDYQRSLEELKIAEQLEAKKPPVEGEFSVELVREFFGDRLDAAATQIALGTATPTILPSPTKYIILSTATPTIVPSPVAQVAPAETPTHSVSATLAPDTIAPTIIIVTTSEVAIPEGREINSKAILVAMLISLAILAVMGYFVFIRKFRNLDK